MKKFYYSFGTDDMFPLKKGWIIMYANTRLEADRKFRILFPARHDGILNCSFVYNEARWAEMDPEHTWPGWKCHGIYGVIPPYVRPQFTREMLTDEIMDTALERCGLNTVSAETMRDACYEWLSFGSIFVYTLSRVEQELADDDGFEGTPEGTVISVAKEVQSVINDEEISAYRDKYVDRRMVDIAMDACGIERDPVLTANLVAAYAVIHDGIEYACRGELEAARLTVRAVAMVANEMMGDNISPNS